MDVQEIIQRTVEGNQTSSLEYTKRFSLCDCMTIKIPDTYTAMGAGLELFLSKFKPGQKFLMPYVDRLPPEELVKMRPVGYKIPKKIDTFIWSPFHEGTSQYYNLGDGIRYSFRLKGGFLVKFGVAKKVDPPKEEELFNQVRQMEEKVNRIWPETKKIIILYETSRMQDDSLKRKLLKFTDISTKILRWPIIQMKLTEKDSKEPKQNIGPDKEGIVWNGWEHYVEESYNQVYQQIEELENKCQ